MFFTKKIKKAIIAVVAAVTLVTCDVGIYAASVNAETVNSYQDQNLNLNVKSAIAIDSNSGQILYAKNANKVLPIASMTKLVTIYLTLEAIKNKRISWNTKVSPTANIVKISNNKDFSNVPLKKDHTYTVRQLYQATLIESANGAAMCLAQVIGGSQKNFVDQMRTQLKKWNINDAKIYTVCGLPNGSLGKDAYPGIGKNAENSMSAADMAIVGQHLLKKYPSVVKTTKLAHKAFKDENETTMMDNFNWMLKGLSQYNAKYPVDGLKTGTTDAAGACFIGTIKHNGGRLITVVMGAQHKDGTDPSRFVQTKKLLKYLFKSYTPVVLESKATFKGANSVRVPDGKSLTTNVGLKNKTVIWDPVDGKQLTTNLNKKTVNAPISNGETISSYTFSSGKEKLISINDNNGMKVDAQALQSNGKANFFVRAWRWITGVK